MSESTTLVTLSSSIFHTTTSTTLAATSTANSTHATSTVPTSIYFYAPSTALAIVFTVLYFLIIPYHFYLSIWKPHIAKSVTQKHSYTIPLLVAVILSTLGFSLRVASVSTVEGRASVGLYASSSTWIIVAPIFVCATLYLMIAHLTRLCLPPGHEQVLLGIGPKWLGRVFITSDVLSFLCQGAGSGIAASNNWEGSQKDMGTAVLIFGLSAQLATFTVYLIVLALFCLRVGKGQEEGTELSRRNANVFDRGLELNLFAKVAVRGVWVASVLVEIRSIYRTIEFGMGVNGYLFRHEWALWVFEAVPMWLALVVLAIYHPTKWLQSKRRCEPVNRGQKMEQNGQDALPQ